METKVTVNSAITLIEIQKDGKAVNQQNPVSHEELGEMLESLEVSGGELAMLSGMPAWAISAVALKAKNLFSAIAQFDPKLGGCLVIHSVSPKYKVGQILPLN